MNLMARTARGRSRTAAAPRDHQLDRAGPDEVRDVLADVIYGHAVNGTTDVSATRSPTWTRASTRLAHSAWGPSYFAPDVKSSVGDVARISTAAVVGRDEGRRGLGRVDLPGVLPDQAPGRGGPVRGVDHRERSVVDNRQDPPSSLFPTYVPMLNASTFKGMTDPVSGSSQPNQVFAAAASSIPNNPVAAIHDAGAHPGHEHLIRSFVNDRQKSPWRRHSRPSRSSREVAYATSQGFKVTT